MYPSISTSIPFPLPRLASLWHSCFHSFICDFCNLLKSSASAAANLCHLAAESNQGGAECALWLAIKWSSALRALYENHRNHRCSWYSNKQINKIAKFIWFINIQINFYVPKAARESRRVPCCLPACLTQLARHDLHIPCTWIMSKESPSPSPSFLAYSSLSDFNDEKLPFWLNGIFLFRLLSFLLVMLMICLFGISQWMETA